VTAAYYFKQTTACAFTLGQFWYGWCLLHGVGIKQDLASGMAYIRHAVDRGCVGAQHTHWRCLVNNIGYKIKPSLTQKAHYRGLIENPVRIAPPIDHAIRRRKLADFVAKIDTDPVVATSKLKQLADRGDEETDAQCIYGWCVIEGIGVCAEPIDAVDYFRLAADKGNADGQYGLGWCLINGVGVERDPAAAADCFKMAAAQENAGALYCLGWCFDAGVGVPQDRAEAVRLWELAAAQGNADAQYTLGILLFEGLEVEHNPAKAVDYLKMADEQEHIHAKYALLLCYSTGTGCEQDSNEADRLRQEVAQYRAYP
jgi:TPR repeat protein